LANRDPLTACYNRRSFLEQLENHWSNAQRHGYPLSCVMLDIDHFKSINDTHGHRRGDEVLQQIASVLRSGARKGDIVCRYGGEEFAVLLPHVDIDGATQAAQRYRKMIEIADFQGVTVTASLGVSATGLGAHDPQKLMDQADACLYTAKREGRNRVVRWDEMCADEIAAEAKKPSWRTVGVSPRFEKQHHH
jgi:diguanylate cyclase (GGDEF)-like protein